MVDGHPRRRHHARRVNRKAGKAAAGRKSGDSMTKLIKAFAPSRRGIVKAAGALAAGIAAPALWRVRPAYAAYPDRTVKIVVANTPGGPSDIIGRLVAAGLQQSTGKTFIIENHGGAGGNIGMEYAARSEPDGYTILLATNAYSINYGLYNAIPYDPFKDFVPVCELGGSPNIFVVKSDLPVKTMKEFIGLAGAVAAAHQIGRVARACDLRRRALARSAGRAHYGRGRLQGLRLCRRRRAVGAGQDAAGQCQMAGSGDAEGSGHAGNERQILPSRLLRARQGRRRGLGARHEGDHPFQSGHRSGRHQEAV